MSKKKTNMIISSPPHENIRLDSDDKNIQSNVENLVRNSFAKHWIESESSIRIQKLTDGLSNVLFSVRSSDHDGVMVKIYGKNSDLIVDRDVEIEVMNALAQFHMSTPILVTFDNGFIYQYALGDSLARGDKSQSLLIARKLAKFHSMSIVDRSTRGQLGEKLRHYVNFFNGQNDELLKRLNLPSDSFLNQSDWLNISKEIDQIESILQNPQGIWSKITVVMCHNDTQSLNFLYNKNSKAELELIDFEHCFLNLWLFDVFNHFVEYAGVNSEQPKFDKDYPSRDQQKKWLEIYLANAHFLDGTPEKQMTLDQLCDFGDRLRALIHLYWSLWAFLQAMVNFDSNDQFNYVKYGKTRFDQYEKYKNDFFTSIE